MDDPSFAAWFSGRCDAAGLKPRHILAGLAARGVVRTRGTIHAWRSGIHPTPELLPALLDVLGVNDGTEARHVYGLVGIPLPASVSQPGPAAEAA